MKTTLLPMSLKRIPGLAGSGGRGRTSRGLSGGEFDRLHVDEFAVLDGELEHAPVGAVVDVR